MVLLQKRQLIWQNEASQVVRMASCLNLRENTLGLNASEAVQALSQGMEGIERVDANLLVNTMS